MRAMKEQLGTQWYKATSPELTHDWNVEEGGLMMNAPGNLWTRRPHELRADEKDYQVIPS